MAGGHQKHVSTSGAFVPPVSCKQANSEDEQSASTTPAFFFSTGGTTTPREFGLCDTTQRCRSSTQDPKQCRCVVFNLVFSKSSCCARHIVIFTFVLALSSPGPQHREYVQCAPSAMSGGHRQNLAQHDAMAGNSARSSISRMKSLAILKILLSFLLRFSFERWCLRISPGARRWWTFPYDEECWRPSHLRFVWLHTFKYRRHHRLHAFATTAAATATSLATATSAKRRKSKLIFLLLVFFLRLQYAKCSHRQHTAAAAVVVVDKQLHARLALSSAIKVRFLCRQLFFFWRRKSMRRFFAAMARTSTNPTRT